MTRLQYLTLNKIVDTAYLCGINKTPVHVIINAPPGSGKTWSTSALDSVDFVYYIDKPLSPSEHRKAIGARAPRTRLLINDDLSLAARWNAKEYFATFCMIADGELTFKQWKQITFAKTYCSIVLCCTCDYFYANYDDMTGIGLFDRLVPLSLGLSNETRQLYQEHVKRYGLNNSIPEPRYPEYPEKSIAKTDIVMSKNINPRLLRNLLRMSQYLTTDETTELIEIAHSPEKPEYEI